MHNVPVNRVHELPEVLTVIVTGAASGIGRAQTNAFLKAGHFVIGLDIQDIKAIGHPNYIHKLVDVSKEEEVSAFFRWFNEHNHQLHILCNTAGILDDFKTIEQTNLQLWNTVIHTNVTSQFLMCQYALKFLLASPGSRIINMASIASLTAGGGGIAYSAAKHAVAGLTKQLAYDYAHTGLRVNAIAPGAIQTAMTRADFENDQKMAIWVSDQTPLKRWAQPEEVAQLSLFLASNAADYMTGNIIPLDGGWMIR